MSAGPSVAAAPLPPQPPPLYASYSVVFRGAALVDPRLALRATEVRKVGAHGVEVGLHFVRDRQVRGQQSPGERPTGKRDARDGDEHGPACTHRGIRLAAGKNTSDPAEAGSDGRFTWSLLRCR